MTYTQLPDGRWQKDADRDHEHKPKAVQVWYMRDNHTFRSLPLDVERALAVLREERDARELYGMLCGDPDGVVPAPVHAAGIDKWAQFEDEAREWLEKAVQASRPPVTGPGGADCDVKLPPPIGWLPRAGVAHLLAKKGPIGLWPNDLLDGGPAVYTEEQARAAILADRTERPK